MQLQENKYYLYKYRDTKILTKTEYKGGELIANDVLKLEGDEDLAKNWEIQKILNKGEIEILETYNLIK